MLRKAGRGIPIPGRPFFSRNSASTESSREIDTSTPTGVASSRLSASLFLYTGFLKRRPDNGRQSQPIFSLRVFSIAQMFFPEGNTQKLNWRSCSGPNEGGTIGADRSLRAAVAGTEDANSEDALIGMADSTACPSDHETPRLIIRPVTL
jgi:hypothetical protein